MTLTKSSIQVSAAPLSHTCLNTCLSTQPTPQGQKENAQGNVHFRVCTKSRRVPEIGRVPEVGVPNPQKNYSRNGGSGAESYQINIQKQSLITLISILNLQNYIAYSCGDCTGKEASRIGYSLSSDDDVNCHVITFRHHNKRQEQDTVLYRFRTAGEYMLLIGQESCFERMRSGGLRSPTKSNQRFLRGLQQAAWLQQRVSERQIYLFFQLDLPITVIKRA